MRNKEKRYRTRSCHFLSCISLLQLAPWLSGPWKWRLIHNNTYTHLSLHNIDPETKFNPLFKRLQWPRLASLLVFLQYLEKLECRVCRESTGHELAYEFPVFLPPNEGLLYLTINLLAAFKKVTSSVESYISDVEE